MRNKSGSAIIFLLVIVVASLVGYTVVKQVYNAKIPNLFQPTSPVACTLEAKLCPDGSSVGRNGPTCEFAACPIASSDVSNWETYKDVENKFSFRYPPTFKTKTSKDFNEVYFYDTGKLVDASPGIILNIYSQTSAATWLAEYLKDPNAKSKTLKLNGLLNVTEAWGETDYWSGKELYTLIEGPNVTVRFFAAPERYVSILDQILSTFKFTN